VLAFEGIADPERTSTGSRSAQIKVTTFVGEQQASSVSIQAEMSQPLRRDRAATVR